MELEGGFHRNQLLMVLTTDRTALVTAWAAVVAAFLTAVVTVLAALLMAVVALAKALFPLLDEPPPPVF